MSSIYSPRYEQRLQAVLDDPYSTTSQYRDAWHEMQRLQQAKGAEQARYDAQIAQLQQRNQPQAG